MTGIPENPRFDGADYVPERDDERLTGQLHRIWGVVSDRRWHTLREIADITGDPEASISAQIRHLRKPRFGGHVVEVEYRRNGLYEYRVDHPLAERKETRIKLKASDDRVARALIELEGIWPEGIRGRIEKTISILRGDG